MKYYVFAVYDHKIRAFMRPHLWVNQQQALRDFVIISNDLDTQIGKHPEDFSFFEIGEYEDEKGEFTNIKHINHGLAATWVRKGEPQ